MFITPHTSVALWISTKTTNPILAFGLSLISHFILDIIPHGDEGMGEHKETEKARRVYLRKVAVVDVTLSTFLIYYYVASHQEFNPWLLTAVILGAWLPDIMWITIETFKIRFMYWYIRFHTWVHRIIDYHYPLHYGVPFQILVTLCMIKITF